MNKRNLCAMVLIGCLLFPVNPLFAEEVKKESAEAAPPAGEEQKTLPNATEQKVSPVPAELAAAPVAKAAVPKFPQEAEMKALEKEGKFQEALEKGEALLQGEGELKPAQRQALEKFQEELKLKQLLSAATATAEAVEYTVKPGDSLWKIAKDNQTTVETLKRTNNLTSDVLRVGQQLKVAKLTYSVEIDVARNTLTLKANGQPIKSYRVATGKPESPTPLGTFTVKNKLENPTWFKAGAILPPDSPQNILGSRWIGFDRKGYGIHGTTEPETVGQSTSSGCIRMLNADVEELSSLIPVGTQVTVVDSSRREDA